MASLSARGPLPFPSPPSSQPPSPSTARLGTANGGKGARGAAAAELTAQRQRRLAERSGETTVFVKPPPPSNFFASAYRTNTASDSLPPSLAISQTNQERLSLLLQSPRGYPKNGPTGNTIIRNSKNKNDTSSVNNGVMTSSNAGWFSSAAATPTSAENMKSNNNSKLQQLVSLSSGEADEEEDGEGRLLKKRDDGEEDENKEEEAATATTTPLAQLSEANDMNAASFSKMLQMDSVDLAHRKLISQQFRSMIAGGSVSGSQPNTPRGGGGNKNYSHKESSNTAADKNASYFDGTTSAPIPLPPAAKTNQSFLPPINGGVVASPRQYTAADPPAIVTGRHAKPQLSPRQNINHPNAYSKVLHSNNGGVGGGAGRKPLRESNNGLTATTTATGVSVTSSAVGGGIIGVGTPNLGISQSNRAAFGTTFIPQAPQYTVGQRMDMMGTGTDGNGGGVGGTNGRMFGGPSRVVRLNEEDRLMTATNNNGNSPRRSGGGNNSHQHQLVDANNNNTNNAANYHTVSLRAQREREAYMARLKAVVTPDLPSELEGDPIAELNAFDHHRALLALQQQEEKDNQENNGGGQKKATGGAGGKLAAAPATSHRVLSNPNLLPSFPATTSLSGKKNRPNGSNYGDAAPDYLEETMDDIPLGTGQHPEETDVGACRRDYQLTKVIFRAAKVHDTYPCRLLRDMGELRVLDRHQAVVHRLGYRRQNREEFHNHIIDIVEATEGIVMRKDTDALFDLFDTNSSGFLDDREIVSGFHWILQGPEETRRIVAAYCKQFLAARNVMEAVVSLMEVEIMAKAVCETCEERYPGVTADAMNIVGFLANHARLGQVSSLSGFVPYPLFYQVVQRSPIFGKVIRILKIDGTLPAELPRTRSPDPMREMKTMIHVAATLENEEGGRRGGGGGGHNMMMVPASSSSGGGAANNNAGGGGSQNNNNNNNGNSDDGSSSVDGLLDGTTTANRGLIDSKHPRFKADTCARLPEYRPTPEHDAPLWVLKNGVLWLSNPTDAPPPLLNTRKASMFYK